MAVPKPPLWAKNNNPEEWWNVNDFEILCAFYQHKVEEFLKMVSPYFPRGSKSENDIPELHTPSSFTGQNTSVSELPAPRRAKVQRFGNDGPSISLSKGNPEGQTDEENPFSSKGNFKDLKEPKKIIPVTSQPPRHPSDDSDSDSEPAKPPKPPCLTKWPATVTSIPDSKPKHYHFNLKLKPESVPQWDGNLDILARWISKINCFTNNFQKLRKN
jgi:hypothetical protein